MPKDYMYETAITIDHEDGTCRVDTTVRGIASQLVRRKFVEVTTASSAPYRRFTGVARQIRFGPLEKRAMSASHPWRKRPQDDATEEILELKGHAEEGEAG